MREVELGIDKLGLNNIGKIHRNLPVEKLIEHTILNQEGKMGMNGATMVDTGKYTGRSPMDKFIVDESTTNQEFWWGPVNRKVDESVFDELFNKVV